MRTAIKIIFCALALSTLTAPAYAATESQNGWHTSVIDAFSGNKNSATDDTASTTTGHNFTDTLKGLPVYIGRTSFAPDGEAHISSSQAVLDAVRVGMNFSFD